MGRRFAARAELPAFLRSLSSDEYRAPPLRQRDRQARVRVQERGLSAAAQLDLTPAQYWASRRGTAAGLRALNAAAGRDYYLVPPEAELDAAAAESCLGGNAPILDVQTHFVADRPECERWNRELRGLYQSVAPTWWRGLDDVTAYDMATWLRCVFGESETDVAVITSAPGVGPERMLFDRELAGTRALFDRLGGEGRLLHHCVVEPDRPNAVEAMGAAVDRFRPAAWKAYTLGQRQPDGSLSAGWWLDDEATGVPFLENARALGVHRVCVHKGISYGAPMGSPRDIGPAAAAFPELDFLVYHSGYEIARGEAAEEGAYQKSPNPRGTDRLIASLRGAGLGPGANVYAELGSTWFCLIRRPEEAAHVLGKLLLAVGPDRVLWGTDSIWYGSPQPAIDAFRAFQIPADLRDRHGYPELTPELKAQILGGNAARAYDIDLRAVRARRAAGELAWLAEISAEIAERGVPSLA